MSRLACLSFHSSEIFSGGFSVSVFTGTGVGAGAPLAGAGAPLAGAGAAFAGAAAFFAGAGAGFFAAAAGAAFATGYDFKISFSSGLPGVD